MVSAKAMVSERLHGYEAGADDYIIKPFDEAELVAKVRVHLRLKAAEDAERALLEQTLRGSVKVLTDILALVNPIGFGQAIRLKRYVGHIASHLALPDLWQFEVAALLSPLGCVTLPTEMLEKVYAGHQLSPEEQQRFTAHPAAGYDLLCHIPRLEAVARMIARQHEPGVRRAEPRDPQQGDPVTLGAQLLKIALDFDQLLTHGLSPRQAVHALQRQSDVYDPLLVAPLQECAVDQRDTVVRLVRVRDLFPGMVLSEDVRTDTGLLVLAKGHEVTGAMVERLRNYAKHVQLVEPFQVQMPLSQ
jgi:response regulator RpfG family c-di-GMP phosphodiesterase